MKVFYFIVCMLTMPHLFAQNVNCNVPLVANGYVIDKVDRGVASLLSGGNSFNNLLDQNLSNFTEIDLTASLLGASIISVKKVDGYFSAGKKAGFVFELPSGLLTLDLLSGLAIRTYKNNILQETIELDGSSSGLLQLSVLNTGDGGKKNIEITTTKDFDEIELAKVGAVSATLNNMKLYYAYVSEQSCDNNCFYSINTANYPTGLSVQTNSLGAGFSNPNNIINNDNLAASKTIVLTGSAYIRVNTTQNFNAGTQVGFELEQDGLLGLLSLNVLAGLRITTYNSSGDAQDTLTASSGLANVGLLSNGRTIITLKTIKPFSSVRLDVNLTLGLTQTYRVYRAIVVLDNDNDGVPNCIDRCTGNDNLVNEHGIPTACNPTCNISAGADVSACPSSETGSVQLHGVGSDGIWSALASNPSSASVSSTGLVEGMQVPGEYYFRYYNGICSDTVKVNFQGVSVDASCNRPLVQPNVVLDRGTPMGGLVCLFCEKADAQNVVDGDLNNYFHYYEFASIVNPSSLIAVKNINQVYDAGQRVGFVIAFPDGLLSLSLLNILQIRTFMDNDLVEVATGLNGLLNAGVIAGPGNKSRVSFVSSQPFNKVELLIGNVANLLSKVNVYNAFVEPVSCENYDEVTTNPSVGCFEILTTDPIQNTQINYDKTGFSDLVCVDCKMDSLSNIIDSDYNKAATLVMTSGVATVASLSVKTKKVFPAGYEAGYAIASDTSLVKAELLSNFTIVTYLNGVEQESKGGEAGLLSLSVLPGGNSKSFVGFRTTKAFNEVRFLISTLVSANVLTDGLEIYYAYARLDSDGDGIPDCMDKCCSGDDKMDTDGDGYPDACDSDIIAQNDTYVTIENQSFHANVLSNDEFGYHGLLSFNIVSAPNSGTAEINDNGTPNDLTDDFIIFTPDSNFYGLDSFTYTICDEYFVCSEATVVFEVVQGITAVDDFVSVLEDSTITIDFLANDFYGDHGLGEKPIEIVTAPQHGTLTIDDKGTSETEDDELIYTPDENFYGVDSFTYQICDVSSECSQATIYVEVEAVNDAPVANDDIAVLPNSGVFIIDVLANDHDDADGIEGGLDVASLTIVGHPSHGYVFVNPYTGELIYSAGNDPFEYDTTYYSITDIGYPQPGKSDTAMLVIQYSEPDLTPSIMIFPSIIYGESAFDIIIDISEIAQATTDGSTISLIIPKDVFMNISFDSDLQSILGFSVNNYQWTYQSNLSSFHVFRTNAVLPSYGTLKLGLNAIFQPQGSGGRKPISVSIIGGGEMNEMNNADVENLIFFEE